jgi:hypothetical protein
VQDDAIYSEVDPFGHVLHLSNPSVAEYVPAIQGRQSKYDVPLYKYFPAGQIMQDTAPGKEYVLEGQFRHFDVLRGRYVPLKHQLHIDAPASEHDVHSDAPSKAYVMAGQVVHADAPAAE